MRTYYNEWDAPTAAWLRELGRARHLPGGTVDDRSIRDVRADDVRDFDQCHFFAGIGGWPLALRLAGYERLPCWTGLPPCQPFSVAGRGLAQADERHLAPVWLDLIRECRPPTIFGEQVADAIGRGWLDDLFDALEGCGYACGAAVLPACSVGAPHIRKRLIFGAVRLADAPREQHDGRRIGGPIRWSEHPDGGAVGGMADMHGDRCDPRREIRSLCAEHDIEYGRATHRLAHASCTRWRQTGCDTCRDGSSHDASRRMGGAHGPDTHHGGWAGADWLGCRDGKFRPVEPGTQPLADGLPARVGRLRGYGNAIVPQAAAVFIQEFCGAFAEIEI